MPAKNFWKFYPSDWRGDPKLRLCGAVARAVWLEMLLVMIEARPVGYLLAPDGAELTIKGFAQISGLSVADIKAGTAELERHGVFGRSRERVILSRKMVRDFKHSEDQRKRVKKRWSAEKAQQSGITQSIPRARVPDTRYQKKKGSPDGDPKEGASPQARPDGRGTRIPVGWYATPELRSYASERDFAESEIDTMEDDFRLFWEAKAGSGARKVDWNATWMTWVRTEEKRRARDRNREDRPARAHAGRLANLERAIRAPAARAGR